MTHTFLVSILLPDGFDPANTAGEIEDDLVADGHDVQEVKMWQAPTLALPQFKSSAIQPPTTQL